MKTDLTKSDAHVASIPTRFYTPVKARVENKPCIGKPGVCSFFLYLKFLH